MLVYFFQNIPLSNRSKSNCVSILFDENYSSYLNETSYNCRAQWDDKSCTRTKHLLRLFWSYYPLIFCNCVSSQNYVCSITWKPLKIFWWSCIYLHSTFRRRVMHKDHNSGLFVFGAISLSSFAMLWHGLAVSWKPWKTMSYTRTIALLCLFLELFPFG